MEVNNVYTSIACNRTPESVDWGNNDLIVFGASHAIAIFDPNWNASSKIINTFIGHTGRVNTVKWIIRHPSTPATEFISGSDDTDCIIWKVQDPHLYKTSFTFHRLTEHTGGVTVVETVFLKDCLTVATAATDSSIKLWRNSGNESSYECYQTISLGNGLCFSIRMCGLPNTNSILMAVATDDDKIHLYTETTSDGVQQFRKIETLIGHEDWVRGLDFITNSSNELLLASSSQDTFIRLWKISPRSSNSSSYKQVVDLLPDEEIQIEERIFSTTTSDGEIYRFSVALESVLLGHDGWVYGVHWNKSKDGTLQLLSSSIDKTMILWAATDDGVWMEKIRVGDVGGNSLGFFGGKISCSGTAILGHGYQGSFHMWRQDAVNESLWLPGCVIGGHFGEVRDLSWEPCGQFFITVSSDQTTRIHVPWHRASNENITWHELARPQVHGYDMQTLAILERYRIASGAEEKIVRTFQGPGNFVENLRRICGLPANDESDMAGNVILESLSKGASVPSLGLSNKAVYETSTPAIVEQKHIKDEYPENYFVPVTLNEPPPEETLTQNTLWPEVQKLYGHGYEVFALCATSDGKLLASSCKATNAEHAQIILWNTITWKQHQKLAGHQLTITQMKFSPDDQHLLSVSRDRRWTIFEKQTLAVEPISSDFGYEFKMIATTDKKNGIHTRIIWTCDWSHDSRLFATGSRDGKCVIWDRSDENVDASSLGQYRSLDVLELKTESITAVAFSHSHWNGKNHQYLVAVGFDSGGINLYCFTSVWSLLVQLDKSLAHHLTVKRLVFRPKCRGEKSVQLASCGDDRFVRIYGLS